MEYSQLQWSTLWTVTQTGTVTNERVAGITGANPFQVNPYFTGMLFGIRVTAKTNLPLAAVRVYGAGNVNGFPAAGAAAIPEALVITDQDLAINTGVLRHPRGRALDNGAPAGDGTDAIAPLRLLPQFLLLEYSTGAPGATPTITFIVEACFHGPVPQGNE